MEIVLALGAALFYGVSDFTGGLLSKRTAAFLVVLVSQSVSFVVLVAVLPLWEAEFSRSAIVWGAAAGIAGVAGASALYRGLAIARMSVVAPISGVLAAAIPVLFGLSLGERPGTLPLIGVAVGLVAVVTVSRTADPHASGASSSVGPAVVAASPSRSGVVEGLAAGIGFGLFFVLLERSPVESGLWPLVSMRVSMVALMGAVVVVRRLVRPLPRGLMLRLAGLGVLNVLADLFYLLATRRGLLSLVAVITSLYPAATVLLARSILHERMDAGQVTGLGFAAASVVLIASG